MKISVWAITASFLTLYLAPVWGQSSDIQLEIKGLRQPVMVSFGYYAGASAFRLDSVRADSLNRVVRFKGKEDMEHGLYFFALPGAEWLDIVVTGESVMTFQTHIEAPTDSFKVVLSRENQPFWYWKTYVQSRSQRIENQQMVLSMIRSATQDQTVIREHIAEINALYADIDSFSRAQSVRYPAYFFSKLIAAGLPPKVPAKIPVYQKDNSVNPAYIRYYRAHFWDEYDFKDKRLLRSNALPDKLERWLQINGPSLDSLKACFDVPVSKSSVNPAARSTVLQLLLSQFEDLSIVNGDAMFVHIFDRYYPSAKAAGIDTATWMRIQYKAELFRPNLIGKKAPEIVLPDQDDSMKTLSAFQADYTMLYFFSPLCKHCAEVTPDIYAISQQFASKGLKVFAVTTDAQKNYWQDFVRQKLPAWTCVMDMAGTQSKYENLYAVFDLPVIYLLDKDKKIVAKRVKPEDLEEVLTQWIK